MLAEEVVGIHEKSREIVPGTRWKLTPDTPDDGLDYAHDNYVAAPRKPMVGIFASCCARFASGNAAAPPSPAMNSRRRIGDPPRSFRMSLSRFRLLGNRLLVGVRCAAGVRPVKASKPPSGADWVHEIKHDGYRMIVRRDGPSVRLYSRNTNDWTARLRVIADCAMGIKAKSFTIDGEAVVLGPDGLSRFEELSRREAADTAILYAFDLIEHGGEDMRNRPFLDRKAALARLLRNTKAGVLFNEHIAEDGPVVFTHACRLGAEGIVSKKINSTYNQVGVRSGSKSAISSASPRSGRGARFGTDESQTDGVEAMTHRVPFVRAESSPY